MIWKWFRWDGFALPSNTSPRVAVAVALAGLAGLAGPAGTAAAGTGLVVCRESSAPPIGLHAAGGAAVKKERPQRTAKSEANKRPVDRKVAWSWLPYLPYLAETDTLTAHRPTAYASPLLVPLPLSACPPACLSSLILSSGEMGRRTQLVIS